MARQQYGWRDPSLPPPPPVGARVRHYGQQYPEAITGTATVVGHHTVSCGHIEVDVHTDKGERQHWAETATVLCRPHIASLRLMAAQAAIRTNLGSDASPLLSGSVKATEALWVLLATAVAQAERREAAYVRNLMPGVPKRPSNPLWWNYDAEVLQALTLADALTGYDTERDELLLHGRAV